MTVDAILAITVGLPEDEGCTPKVIVRTVTPKNNVTRIAAIQVSVIAALRVSGLWKTGTALEIASIPVIAEQPVANERKIKKSESGSTASTVGWNVAIKG